MAIATKPLSPHGTNPTDPNQSDRDEHDYDHDFYAWTQEQSRLLRTGQLQLIDIQHLAEEIEDMGRAERRELESRLEILLMHLLKWQFQPSKRSRSWQLTIKEQRLRLQKHLKQNPSLKAAIADVFDDAYQLAVVSAERETGLDIFPDICPYLIEQVLIDAFLPTCQQP
ncbi:DUF29 domain-containing protein [Pseudanabaena mucicola]|uniref:DUF29 domain-containing protein n=1 Tax=Pseudanabaena mucicola FACHB-723 TaxID=2692860 RepID=A0ABR7ZW34_9CYAN|nr:DUF29 domain-containing protein [Pseudanabaena mucicola]MBD2188183.1 DUF29 domain-containing protein [Pseudanabaena mucicola FACHB-723]